MSFIIVSSIVSVIYIFLGCFTFLRIIPLPLFFILVLVPLIISIIVKVIIECKMYGKRSVVSIFKKAKTEADRKDIFLKSLQEQIDSNVFISNKNSRMILIVNSNGIYLYSFLQDEGSFFAKENNWYLKNGRYEKEVLNPIFELEEEEKKIEILLDRKIISCFVLDTATFFREKIKRYPTLSVVNAPYYICKTDIDTLKREEINNIVKDIGDSLLYKKFNENGEGDLIC